MGKIKVNNMEEVKIGDYVIATYKSNKNLKEYGLVISVEKSEDYNKFRVNGFYIIGITFLKSEMDVYSNLATVKIISKDKYDLLLKKTNNGKNKIIFKKCITKEELENNPELKNSKKLITLKIKNLGDGSALITKKPYEEYKSIGK